MNEFQENGTLASLLVFVTLATFAISVASCDSAVEPKSFSELTPENTLSSESGLNSTLMSAYAEFQLNAWIGKSILNTEEWTTDIEWETGGGENRTAVQMNNFNWNASTGWLNFMWTEMYNAIRNANIVLENIESVDIDEELRSRVRAEAKFIRAVSYVRLYLWYGPVPLRTSTEQELEIPRASEDELLNFIESELQSSISDLPKYGNEPGHGRAHKSAARAHLTKFYLNTKQWQKTADMANTIIQSGNFQLYPDFVDMFKVENEKNSSYIWVHPATTNQGNLYPNGAFPPGFNRDPETGNTWTSSMNNWAAQYRLKDSFYNSFEQGDERRIPILDEYINQDGSTVSLTGNDNTRALKFFDPSASANNHGNDIPDIRYADILLSRAEALNELNGPNQASIDLINAVRNRAGLDDVDLSDFNSKSDLRSHILKERGWEFYSERKRRQDLIRHGKFIEFAQDQGKTNAQSFHRRFPIPQSAMDSNPALDQNEGY